jgi:predicted RNA-binding Zn-ribbon protein involved in translation (DUF1610 family)
LADEAREWCTSCGAAVDEQDRRSHDADPGGEWLLVECDRCRSETRVLMGEAY